MTQSVMSATDMLGLRCTWLVCHRSSSEMVDLHLHYAQGCWHAVITGVGNRPPQVCSCGDNTTPISNDSVAPLELIVQP